MYLVIAEKPELGRAIADAIPGPGNYDKGQQTITKTWKGQPITVVWCFGHLLTLVEPEDYDEKYAGKWTLENLPFFFENWRHKPKPAGKNGKGDTSTRVAQIGRLLKQADVVIHAGDIDDEGQLLVDEVLRYCHYKGRVLRLNTNDTSKKALAKALENMDDNKLHEANGWAAYGRQMSDKTFGYNLSQYYTIINGGVTMHVGRVKMPTLGLVVRRDRLIENHKKTLFYTIHAPVSVDGQNIICKYVPSPEDPHLNEDKLITDKDYMNQICMSLKGRKVSPVNITVTEQNEPAPLPFNLVKLYAYCSNKWGMQPGKVRQITQTLRDNHHAITYNRTNCQYLSTAMFEEAPQTVLQAAKNIGISAEPFDTTVMGRCFNDANVTEHTAIIPTNSTQDLSSFTADEKKVYEVIALYYLAQFMPPAKKIVSKLDIPLSGGAKLAATSTYIASPGYRALLGTTDFAKDEDDEAPEDSEAEERSVLSSMRPGTYSGTIGNTALNQQETKPKQRYTAASLIKDMTSIAKYVTNPAVKKLLLQKDKNKKDEHGSVGTPATRDLIVKELVDAGYLREETKGKKTYLISTQMGREFYDMLPASVREVDVSAKWWCEQEQIKAGELTPNDMAKDVLRTVTAIIQSGSGSMENAQKYQQGFISDTPVGTCPKCKKNVFETAKGFKCESPDCDLRITKADKFFTSQGKKLTAKAVSLMLRDGRITVKNLKSPKGFTYDATVICDFTSGPYPAYSFEKRSEEPVGQCPKCGEIVMEQRSSFSCRNKECQFVIWKETYSLKSIKKALTVEEAKALLETGHCRFVGKSKKGKSKCTYDYSIDWSGDKPKDTLKPAF